MFLFINLVLNTQQTIHKTVGSYMKKNRTQWNLIKKNTKFTLGKIG